MELIGLIVAALVIWKLFSLQRQIDELRSGAWKSNQNISRSAPLGVVQSVEQETEIAQQNIAENSPTQSMPTEDSAAIKWLKENWLLKLGVFLIILGFGWFVSYAFVHNWIGPVGRITLGFLLGAAIMTFGDFRMKKSESQGSTFLVLGAAIILITISAARFIYEFFNPLVALIFIFLTASFLTLESFKYNRKQLAISGLIIASIAPVLINSPKPDAVGLFLYVGVVTISSIWIMFKTNWREIGAISALVLFLYSLFFGLSGDLGMDKNLVLAIVFGLAFIFFAANIFSINRSKESANSSDMFLATINGINIIFWTISTVTTEWQSLVLAFWMIIFAIGSFFVFQQTRRLEFFFIYALTSIVYLATATALELEGSALAFAYIFESAVISIAGYVITSNQKVGQTLGLLMIGPALMTIPNLEPYRWRGDFLDEDFGLVLCMGAALLLVGLFYYFVHKEQNPEEKSGAVMRVYSGMIIAGSFYIYALIWLTMSSIYSNAVAVTISLAIYTIVGIVSYLHGRKNELKVYRNYGAALVIFVVGRLILVDIWTMELAVRIVAFIVIGILLVSTAFFAGKKKELINN